MRDRKKGKQLAWFEPTTSWAWPSPLPLSHNIGKKYSMLVCQHTRRWGSDLVGTSAEQCRRLVVVCRGLLLRLLAERRHRRRRLRHLQEVVRQIAWNSFVTLLSRFKKRWSDERYLRTGASMRMWTTVWNEKLETLAAFGNFSFQTLMWKTEKMFASVSWKITRPFKAEGCTFSVL